MQTSEDSIQDRDDLLIEIAGCKVTIYQRQYAIRWYTRAVRLFWIGLLISIIVFAILIPLIKLSVVQSVLSNIGQVSVTIALLLGSGIGVVRIFSYFTESSNSLNNHLDEIKEAKFNLVELEQKLEFYDEYNFDHFSPQEQHMRQLPNLIALYRRQADRYRSWFIITQIIIIILSAAITSLSGGWIDKYISIPWIIPVCSAFISILTSITLFFKFREKGSNLQQTADSMDLEYKSCQLGIKDYKGLDRENALVLLAERTEELRKEQQQRQQQLEQSSQTEQKALQSES